VSVAKDGTVTMEGWAVVDNTSGEDWQNVIIGVGSSSALSFHYDLWSVRTIERPTLATEERFAVAPPTAVSPYGGPREAGKDGAVLTELTDEELRLPDGHPGNDYAQRVAPNVVVQQKAPSIDTGSGKQGITISQDYIRNSYSVPSGAAAGRQGDDLGVSVSGSASVENNVPVPPTVAQGDTKLRSIVPGAVKRGSTIVIVSVADGNKAGGERRATDRANIVRNQLIDEGVAPAQIQIDVKVAAGERDHVRLVERAGAVATAGAPGQAGNPSATADGAPIGESHFQSTQTMTVGKGTSAMVSMVKATTDGEEVYLYDPESDRGNDRFAFRAIRIRNPTDSTLETGPVTVYGDDRFIGEGLTEPIPPRAAVVIPFALDRQVVVEVQQSVDDRLAKLLTLERGILTAEIQHIRRKKLTITNRLREPTKVYVRHTVGKGWTLAEGPKVYERIGDAHLFEILVDAQSTTTVDIAESTPLRSTLDLSTRYALGMLHLFLEKPELAGELQAPLEQLLTIHRELLALGEEIVSVRRRLADYRARMDELHAQLMSLKLVKTSGDLMAHLKKKMIDISSRVQKLTIELVDLEEKLMMARVRFQDHLAELHL
jgi:hypothetical protein